jgi:tripartite-type tricarboxylate transporter receptor subunit TctC
MPPAGLARRCLLALPLAAPAARAQWAPTRAMRLLVPFPAGGTTDMLSRLTAERMGAALGTSIVVDNRPGASGALAATIAAQSEPDGHSLFFCTIGTAATNRFIQRNAPDVNDQLADVGSLFALPNVATVPVASPWRTLADFIAAARAAPGALTYGSSGAGSSLHLTGAMLAHRAGLDLLHVPYRGGGQMLNELIAGRISIAFGNLPTAIPLVRDGALRALAVTGATRNVALPDVPAFAETLPGFQATVWYGLQVPRATPAAAVQRLNAAANAMLADNDVRARLAQHGVDALGGTPAEFTRFIAAETTQWREIITAARITAD